MAECCPIFLFQICSGRLRSCPYGNCFAVVDVCRWACLVNMRHTGIYTTTHWHLYKSCLSFVSFLNSSWHSAMNGMQTNKMHAIHGKVLPNFSFSFPNSSWHSAMNGMRTNKMHAIHGRVLPNFSFPNMFWQTAIVPLLPLLCSHRCLQMGMFGKYETHWQFYNNTLAFIQQHTGIYTSHVFHPFPSQTLHGTLP